MSSLDENEAHENEDFSSPASSTDGASLASGPSPDICPITGDMANGDRGSGDVRSRDSGAQPQRSKTTGTQSTRLTIRQFNETRHNDNDPSNPAPVEALEQDAKKQESGTLHLATSTFLSLLMVLALLLIVRWMVPGVVESIRYSWHRGQLRAEYELSGEELTNVSLKSIEKVSELVSRRVGPTVVHIDLGRFPLSKTAQGSGFVISQDGYILTNHHVVKEGAPIKVTFADGRVMEAEVVGEDPHTDLAVLRVDAEGLMVSEWGSSDNAAVGAPVWAVGSPFGFQHTVSFGILSGKHRVDFGGAPELEHMNSEGVGPLYGDLMQSDVSLHPGNSGGPLVNSVGQIIGVNTAILGDKFQGISFAIPSRIAQRVTQELIADGRVKRGWLGVQLRDRTLAERTREDGGLSDGVVVVIALPDGISPAREAGLRRGDVILSFNGEKVESVQQLQILIADARSDALVDVVVERRGKQKTFQVKLAERVSR